MATGSRSDNGSQLGKSQGLSTEQLRRMEENRLKAQARRLAMKRAGPQMPVHTSTGTMYSKTPQCGTNRGHRQALEQVGPPPEKRPAIISSTMVRSGSVASPGTLANPFRKQLQCHGGHGSGNKSPMSTTVQEPFDVTRSSGLTNTFSYASQKHVASQSHTQKASSSSASFHQSTKATSLPSFMEIQRAIKGTVTLISRTRFKVVVSYDLKVIEIFKRMPSRTYDAKTATWSFGIEDYGKLVDTISRECKYVQLDLVPKPVISLFLSRLSGTNSCDGPGIEWNRIDEVLVSALMQFQREGVEFCIRHGGRVLLADDMGLGKTLQAIAVMSYYRSEWPLLIVCPSSVRFTWAEAFKRWVPSLPEVEINVVLTSKSSATSGLVNIISYDLLVKMAKDAQDKKFKAVIADESHFLKNYRTARYKALQPIIKGAARSLLLSGTPALSRPIELYTQITALDKSFRVSLVEFGLRYCNGVKSHFGWDFSGASNMLELQMYMELRIMIRRLKNDVLDQLPSKQRQMVLLEPSLTKGKSKEWKQMRQELDKAGTLKPINRKGALLPLFSRTGMLKIPAVISYILDILEGGRKLIVFAHHKAVLDAISECLAGKSYHFIRIDGQTPAEVRQTYCDQFQHDEGCLVAVLSITTANAGLTLTAAATVVFAELFWNPGILVQAEDRAYRIGQKSSVNVHYLVAKDTADDFIWPLIQSKLQVLSQAGLAREDFSNADSKVLKDMSQMDLFDCFDKLVSTDDGKLACQEIESSKPPTTLKDSSPNKHKCTTIDDPDFKESKSSKTKEGSDKGTDSQRGGSVCTDSPRGRKKVTVKQGTHDFANTKGTGTAPLKDPCISSSTGLASDQPSASRLATYLINATNAESVKSKQKPPNASVEDTCKDRDVQCGDLQERGEDDWFARLDNCDLDAFANFDDDDDT